MPTDILFFIAWYVAASLLGFLILPITFRIFVNLPDRGYSFTKPIGLLLLGYVFWILGANRFLYYNLGGILASIIIIIGLGIGLQKKEGLSDIRNWIIEHRRTVLFVEVLFLLLFAGWTCIRIYNPEIYGTEKPMEYMFLNSILRSSTFPPIDAWLSDHAISYYYFGYFLIATLTQLTNTPSPIAFNLGIALLFAMSGVTAQGVVMNLVALVRREIEKQPAYYPRILEASFWNGLLGPLVILVVGNWYGAIELIHNNGLFADTQIPMIWYDYGQPINPDQIQSMNDFAQRPGARAGMINLWEWLDLKQLERNPVGVSSTFKWDLPNWFYASRVIHDRDLIGVETEAIDEMPAFSFLLADMHPHVLSLSFVISTIALALEWLLTAMNTSFDTPSWAIRLWFPWDKFLLTTILLGSLVFLNTWDFPIYWFLVVLSFCFGLGIRWGITPLFSSWKYPLFFAMSLLAISLLLYWPYLLTFQSQAGGILPNLIYPTRFQQTLVMFGPVLPGISAFLLFFVYRARKTIDRKLIVYLSIGVFLILLLMWVILGAGMLLKSGSISTLLKLSFPLASSDALSLLLQRRLVDSTTSIFAAVIFGLTAGIGISTIHNIQTNPLQLDEKEIKGKPVLLMVLGIILTGSLLLIGPEFVYLRDNFVSRMNTVFKFYFQIWVLWGIASSFSIWYIWHFASNWFRKSSSLVWCVCILLGGYYLLGSLPSKTSFFANPTSLDGMAYFAKMYPDDWAAIEWLQENAQDGQVILEGSKGAYWMEGPSSRFSMATGLPTVMGWYNHEAQWRGENILSVDARLGDIQTIYQSRDWAITQELLDQYQIEYVIIGSFERNWYNPIYLAKFDRFMTLVFTLGNVLIYSR